MISPPLLSAERQLFRENMNVLLIACSYPPDPVVGAFRAAKVAEAFHRAGHDVRVITRRIDGDTGSVRSSDPGLRVETVPVLPGPVRAFVAAKQRLKGGEKISLGKADDSDSESRSRDREIPLWKRHLLAALRTPDSFQGFILPAITRALPILREGIDLVYTTAPPFSDHLIGLALKQLTGVRWVAEFRDPWTDNRNQPAHLRSAPADRLDVWLESACLLRADRVVSVSEGIQELLMAKVPSAPAHRFVLALNGIDELASVPERTIPEGPFRIVHTGSFYGCRDPRPFLRALAAVVTRRGLTNADVRVDFVGHCRTYLGISVEQFASELDIGAMVHFHDWMPQEEARAISSAADLLLLPFPARPHLIPNKLYDYLGTRKPILAFLDGSGEPARMLRRLGGHYVITDGEDAVSSAERALETALHNRRSPRNAERDEAILREWTTEQQMEQLLNALTLTSPTLPNAVAA